MELVANYKYQQLTRMIVAAPLKHNQTHVGNLYLLARWNEKYYTHTTKGTSPAAGKEPQTHTTQSQSYTHRKGK